MWDNAQRDRHPAEYRWRPLFKAAKFGWRPILECHAVTLPRRDTCWNLKGCPKLTKRSQPLVSRSSPYSADMVPQFGNTPMEFHQMLWWQTTTISRLPCDADCTMIASFVLTQYLPVTERESWMDRQTESLYQYQNSYSCAMLRRDKNRQPE